MAKERTNTLYPTNLKNKTELREFVKNVLLNLDFPSYENNVKYLLHQSLIPKDITEIISEFIFCNKHQWDDATKECIKMYSQDLQDFDFFIDKLNHDREKYFLHDLERLRHSIKDTKESYFHQICLIYQKFSYNYFHIIDKLNMYIHVLKIDILDMSYRTYFLQEINFDIKYKIDYEKGIDMEMLFLYLYNKVSDNCKKISPNFKLNLEDEMTRITWNFNVHARLEKEKSIDGLMACHTGALFGYFFLKLIETIRLGMLKRIRYNFLDIKLSLSQR
jgi:hypothetical protein